MSDVDTPAAASAAPAAPPRPRPRRRLWPIVLLVLLALVVALVGGVGWALRSEAGQRWLLSHVPNLQVEGQRGALDGGPFEVARMAWQGPGLVIDMTGLSWRDAVWRFRPHAGAWIGLELVDPHLRRLGVQTGDVAAPKPAAPLHAPKDLLLPIELIVRGLQIDKIEVDQQAPITDLKADLHLGDDAGAMHRITSLSVRAGGLQVDGNLQVAASGGLATQGHIGFASLPDMKPVGQGEVRVGGTLAQLTLDAALRGAGAAQATVQTTLMVFQPWPLGTLNATLNDLDLTALGAGLPSTKLSGRVSLDSQGMDAPYSARLELQNASPGPVDEGRIPLRDLSATLQGRPNDLYTLDLKALQASLEGRRAAGRVSGEGRLAGSVATLELTLDGLRPGALDTRAADLTLNGPLKLALRGLPLPAPAGSAEPLTAEVHADLNGRVAQPTPQPVRVALDATYTASADQSLRVDIEKLQLSAGAATAQLSAKLSRDARQGWQVRSEGRFAQFDPAAWWLGPSNSPWQRGKNALNGDWSADVTLPDAALAAADPRALAQALRGSAQLTLKPSQLAGLPLGGDVRLQASPGTAQVDASLQLARNTLQARMQIGARETPDHAEADVQAPALAALAPLFALLPGSERWAPQAGSLEVHAVADGHWPTLRTEGRLRASDVRSAAGGIGKAEARWTATTGDSRAPLSLVFDAQALAYQKQRIDRVQADLSGTLLSHRLQLTASSPVRPPAWTDAAPGTPTAPSGSRLTLNASGGWTAAADGAGTWRGSVQNLNAAPRQAGAAPWIDVRDLRLQAELAPQGGLARIDVEPGRLELLGSTLRWTEARYAAAGAAAAPSVSLDAQLDPMAVAPWLSRLQPNFGWGGDLRIGASIQVHLTQRLEADVLIERNSGDLKVTDEAGTRELGLSDLRFALGVHDGTWQLTQALAGSRLGVLGGAQTVRTSPSAIWPEADAPLQGGIELRVADLGIWGRWVPAGWRIGGQLHTSASLAGSFGAPDYTGRVEGAALSVRNLLEGVKLSDGEVVMALRGQDARIERFVLKSGPGELRIEGGATFGSAPRADLKLIAEHFEAIGRLDRRIVVSGNANAALQAERITVDGRFTVDEGLVDVSRADAPSLDSDVVVINRPGAPLHITTTSAAAPTNGAEAATPATKMQTDVAVLLDLGEKLRLKGHGLNTLLGGELRITTPNGKLAVNGTVRTESGTFAAYGQNLAIERGIIAFSGDVATPRLDIVAIRPDVDTRVGVSVQGSTSNPRIRLFSEPDMSEIDKLSWLVLGRASDGVGGADMALLQRAAVALLSGESADSSGGLLKGIGLDEFSVSQSETGDARDTVVSLGKQLSKRVFVGYERGLNATTGSWQLIYRVARQFTLRARSGEQSSVDAIYTWRWD